MSRGSELYVGAIVALAYLVWGSFLVGTCVWPIAEECIAARWSLTFTGLPSSLLLVGLGGVDVPVLVLVAMVGAAQWAILAVLVVRFLRRRLRASAGTTPNISLNTDARPKTPRAG